MLPPPDTSPEVAPGGSVMSTIFATKASDPPLAVVWKAPAVVGKLPEPLDPVT